MTTSATYTFDPEIAEICDEAFERCGVDPTSLVAKHVVSARRSLNYVFTEWATRGVHLWAVKQTTQVLATNTDSYAFPTSGIAVLDMVIEDPSGNVAPVSPMSRKQYLELPNKTLVGVTANYYHERSLTPLLYVWPVLDATGYSLIYNYMQQLQISGAAANTLAIPQIWQEAIASALAAKLAEKYAPDREQNLISKAEFRYKEANGEDRERVESTFTISKYRRR